MNTQPIVSFNIPFQRKDVLKQAALDAGVRLQWSKPARQWFCYLSEFDKLPHEVKGCVDKRSLENARTFAHAEELDKNPVWNIVF